MKKLLLLLLCVPLLFTTCKKDLTGKVEYEVSSSHSGFVTYGDGNGNGIQDDIDTGYWTYSFTGTSGDYVHISVSANNENASVMANIYYKGNLIETATSNTPDLFSSYVTATASGILE